MYNIDLYTYWKKPFTSGKNFSIRPLDEEGKETYYSDKSHVRHYLKRTDPFVFKSIVGVDYNTLVRQQKEDIQMLKNLKEKGFNPKEPTPNNAPIGLSMNLKNHLNHLILKQDLDLIIKKEISKLLMDMRIKQDLNQMEKNTNIQ